MIDTLIRIMAISIPLMFVAGCFILQPLLAFLQGRDASQQVQALERRVHLLERTAKTMERSMMRLLEEREFDRQLLASSTSPKG